MPAKKFWLILCHKSKWFPKIFILTQGKFVFHSDVSYCVLQDQVRKGKWRYETERLTYVSESICKQ